MFEYLGDFIANESVPDTYNYTKLFSPWKKKGRNMMRYIHGKGCDTTLVEALISERMA